MIWNQCRSKVVNTLAEWEGWFTQTVGAEHEDRKSRPFGGGLYTTVDKVDGPERYPAIAFIHFAHSAETFFIYQDQILELMHARTCQAPAIPVVEKPVEVLPEPIED